MPTPLRAMRIPEDVWRASLLQARSEDTSVTAVVVAALRAYIKPPGQSRGRVARAVSAGSGRDTRR